MIDAGNEQRRSGYQAGANGVRLWQSQRCEMPGCAALTADRRYCWRCEEEIAALNCIYAEPDDREAWAHMALWRAGMAVRRRLWIPMLAVVVGSIAYLGWVLAPAVLDWIAQ